MGIKDKLKKVSKGLLVAATSLVVGATLEPLVAGAVGSFVAKKIGELGVKVTSDLSGTRLQI